jgi:aspartate racemase
MIGVIGGMGPLATADFLNKVIAATPAEHDDEHVPLLISNDPRIPRRPAAILEGAESPLPRLREIRDRLIAAGATALVMPCNTAHHWHAALAADCPVPFPSIIDAACDEVAARSSAGGRVGLVATRATLAARLFEPALAARGRLALLPNDALLDSAMLPAIAHIKAGRLTQAGPLMARAVQALLDQGAEVVVLACTEAPIALAPAPANLQARCVDATQSLANATVALWLKMRASKASSWSRHV